MDYLASHLARPLTPDHAANALDVAIDSLTSFTDIVEQSADDILAHLAPPTPDEVEAFKMWVLSNPRTPEWDAVIDRINAGDLSWHAIASGEVDRDQGVDAAMRSIPRIDRTELPDLREGAPGADAPEQGSSGPAEADDTDEYDNFDGFTFRA